MSQRYEIHLANLDPTIGSEISKTRPVVIVSDDRMNENLRTIVACPLTTMLHPSWRPSPGQVRRSGGRNRGRSDPDSVEDAIDQEVGPAR